MSKPDGLSLYFETTMDNRRLKRNTPGAGIFSPLNLPTYLTWLAVSLGPQPNLSEQGLLSPHGVVGLLGQFAFLGAFVLRAWWEEHGRASSWLRGAIIVQAVAALASTWGFEDKMQAVLLVLVAAQLPMAAGARWSGLTLTLSNAVLLGLLLQLAPLTRAIQVEISYIAFQLFAALVTAYAYRAHEAREETLRINAELLATRKLLEEGTRTEERLRLSRDLHDVMGHKLTALKLQLSLQSRRADGPRPELLQCLRLVDDLLIDARGVVNSLRESEGVDLHRALRALDPGLPQPRVLFDLDITVRVPDIRQAEAMLRCAQEGLTNALRHSAATEVRIILANGPDGLALAVEDNGAGRASGVKPGNGLRGLQERLQELGGRLRLEGREPHGLVLRAVLPHAAASL